MNNFKAMVYTLKQWEVGSTQLKGSRLLYSNNNDGHNAENVYESVYPTREEEKTKHLALWV